jgi:MazG family protein
VTAGEEAPVTRLHLIYVGAAAELAPAATLRALQGSGAALFGEAGGLPAGRGAAERPAGTAPAGSVVVPPDLTPALHELIAGAVVGELREVAPAGAGELVSSAGSVVVAVAGDRGPALARELLARAAELGIEVATTPPQPAFDDCLAGQELVSLQRITRILREQCPWDRVQTAGDIVSYSLEEVYELADAIARGDLGEQHGELGDVLFQVYFLSLLLQEQGGGDLGSVAAAIEGKLIRRHQHIFGDVVADTPSAVRGQWERIKREQEGRRGIFHDVPGSLPALLFARKLQRRAAEVGFDWATALEAFPKIAEEHGELGRAMAAHGAAPDFDHPGAVGEPGPASAAPGIGSVAPGIGSAAPEDEPTSPPSPEMRHDPRLRHEFGDLLFAVVNVARKAGIDPELALREAAQRFERRVTVAAELAAAEDEDWSALGLDEQERYYQRAKQKEGGGR